MPRFGAYQTLVDLGRGGMADLYVARLEPPVGKTSADSPLCILKTLRPPVNERRIEMFLDEARLGQLFDHPNVVRTYDVGEEAGRPFLALEFLDGQSLDRLLRRTGLPGAFEGGGASIRWNLLWILAESLWGLHYAHDLASRGTPLHIVHRDFTPQNVFVTYDGRVKVLDFGIAKSSGRIYRTTTGEVKGKLRYMAPEQALGLRIDRRADIFSAGAMLFELCSGRPLWRPDLADRDVFDDLVGGAYPVELPGESAAMNTILRRALARDASERYRTAEEMRLDLIVEIARHDRIDKMGGRTATLVSTVFADQRDRTARMLSGAGPTSDSARGRGAS